MFAKRMLAVYLSGTAIDASIKIGNSMYKEINSTDSPEIFASKVSNHILCIPFVLAMSMPWPFYVGKMAYDKVRECKKIF